MTQKSKNWKISWSITSFEETQLIGKWNSSQLSVLPSKYLARFGSISLEKSQYFPRKVSSYSDIKPLLDLPLSIEDSAFVDLDIIDFPNKSSYDKIFSSVSNRTIVAKTVRRLSIISNLQSVQYELQHINYCMQLLVRCMQFYMQWL